MRNPFRNRPGSETYEQSAGLRSLLNHFDHTEMMKWDADIWRETLNKGVSIEPGKRQLIENLFKIMRFGGVYVRSSRNAGDWAPFPYAIASLFSHGGRVMVQLPKLDAFEIAGQSFWQWFTAGCTNIIQRVGTHSVSDLGDNPQYLTGGVLKYVVEKSGLKYGAKQYFSGSRALGDRGSYGVNIALGGYGNSSIASNRVLTDDGSCGHMYIYYMPATQTKVGCMMIGLEGDAPGCWGDTGNFHSWNIGFIDKMRKNKPNKDMGLVTGFKWKRVNKAQGGTMKVGDKDSRLVDLTRVGWQRIREMPWQNDFVAQPPQPITVNYQARPINAGSGTEDYDRLARMYNVTPPSLVQVRQDLLRKMVTVSGQGSEAYDTSRWISGERVGLF